MNKFNSNGILLLFPFSLLLMALWVSALNFLPLLQPQLCLKSFETEYKRTLENDFNSQVLLICRLNKYDLCARVCGDGKRDDVVGGEKIIQTCLGFAAFLVGFDFWHYFVTVFSSLNVEFPGIWKKLELQVSLQ